jgi:allophanate hydrolase
MSGGGTLLLSRHRAAHNLHWTAREPGEESPKGYGSEMPRPETVADILSAHRAGSMTPADTVARCYARIRAHADPAIFISLRAEQDALAEAHEVAARSRDLPLYGVPVAVKDNIDAAGMATTAACPAFAYHPPQDATAVARLRQAGAIVVG